MKKILLCAITITLFATCKKEKIEEIIPEEEAPIGYDYTIFEGEYVGTWEKTVNTSHDFMDDDEPPYSNETYSSGECIVKIALIDSNYFIISTEEFKINIPIYENLNKFHLDTLAPKIDNEYNNHDYLWSIKADFIGDLFDSLYITTDYISGKSTDYFYDYDHEVASIKLLKD